MKHFLISLMVLTLFLPSGCLEEQSDSDIGEKHDNYAVYNLKPRAVEIVRTGLLDKNGIIRTNSIEVVSEAGLEELMPVVAKLITDDLTAVRFAAAVSIGDMRYSAAENSLMLLLHNENENLRIAGAYGLVKLGKRRYADIVRKSLKSKNQQVRANAVWLLGKMGYKKDVKLLYDILGDANSGFSTKAQAEEAIARIGDANIYPRLWELLISKFADDRVMGIRAMGLLGTKDAQDSLVKMLYDDVLEVRLCAAEELGRLGDKTGEPVVLDYFTLKKPNLHEESVTNTLSSRAIGHIGGSLTKYLPKYLDSRSKVVRLNGAYAVLISTR